MSLNTVPADVMRHLTSLQELDLSNNQIKTMSDTCFHFLKNIHVLALHDNRIEQVMKGTFQVEITKDNSKFVNPVLHTCYTLLGRHSF